MSEKPPFFRILSLDGGGMRGALSAKILEQVEKQIWEKENKSLTEYFDLVAGTSTGSILAAGIALGLKASDLFKIYDDKGKDIFSCRKRHLRKLGFGLSRLGLFARYSNKGLKEVLEKKLVFSNHLSDLATDKLPSLLDIEKSPKSPNLLILAYDTTHGSTQYFASNAVDKESGKPEWFTNQLISDICICSAAAPTFFPPYKLTNNGKEITYIDGGVAANNPDLAAITHAIYTKTRVSSQEGNSNSGGGGLRLSDISLLSIGTGKIKKSFKYKEVDSWGLVKWATKIPDIFLAAPAQFEEAVTRQLISSLTEDKPYLRLNIDLKGKSDIDDPGIIEKLVTAYDEQKARIKYLDFTDMTSKTGRLEDLVNDFIHKNCRTSDQDYFKNRFG